MPTTGTLRDSTMTFDWESNSAIATNDPNINQLAILCRGLHAITPMLSIDTKGAVYAQEEAQGVLGGWGTIGVRRRGGHRGRRAGTCSSAKGGGKAHTHDGYAVP